MAVRVLARVIPDWVPAVWAFLIACVFTYVLTHEKLSRLVLDRPNKRSLHLSPVPRTGGLALFAGAAAAGWFSGAAVPPDVVLGAGVVAAVSLLDDVRDVPAAARLAVHLAAAAWVVFGLAPAGFSLLAALCVVLWIAWAANLYNFMDGADGLAAGMAVIGYLTYGLAASVSGDEMFARANFVIAAAAAGFLVFNFEPAKIFLGDVGAVPLGFLAAALGFHGWVKDVWPMWFPIVVFSPFVVDSTITLARRAYRRERLWRAHRDHYYQRLVQLGWGHRRTALVEYALMAGVAALALATLAVPAATRTVILLTLALFYVIAIFVIDLAWRKHLAESRS